MNSGRRSQGKRSWAQNFKPTHGWPHTSHQADALDQHKHHVSSPVSKSRKTQVVLICSIGGHFTGREMTEKQPDLPINDRWIKASTLMHSEASLCRTCVVLVINRLKPRSGFIFCTTHSAESCFDSIDWKGEGRGCRSFSSYSREVGDSVPRRECSKYENTCRSRQNPNSST